MLIVKDSCEQSGVNTIEGLQGFHPLLIGDFWPPFLKGNVVSTFITFFLYSQVTSGEMIYNELKNDFSKEKCARFYRIAPTGEKVQSYSMDEIDALAMIRVC